jgi:hypothetical protein
MLGINREWWILYVLITLCFLATWLMIDGYLRRRETKLEGWLQDMETDISEVKIGVSQLVDHLTSEPNLLRSEE